MKMNIIKYNNIYIYIYIYLDIYLYIYIYICKYLIYHVIRIHLESISLIQEKLLPQFRSLQMLSHWQELFSR